MYSVTIISVLEFCKQCKLRNTNPDFCLVQEHLWLDQIEIRILVSTLISPKQSDQFDNSKTNLPRGWFLPYRIMFIIHIQADHR